MTGCFGVAAPRASAAPDVPPGQPEFVNLLDGGDGEAECVGRGFEVAVAGRLCVGRVLGGVDDYVGAASRGERTAAGRIVAGDDAAYAVCLEHEDDGQANRPAADHDGDVLLVDLRSAHGVLADGHGLGEGGLVGRQTIGDGQRERLLDDEAFGVAARGGGREPDGAWFAAN
jgi:hypothetical protein